MIKLAKKKSTAEEIRDYFKSYPDSKAKHVAKATGSSEGYVYTVLGELIKRRVYKKRKKVRLAPKKVRLAPKKVRLAPSKCSLKEAQTMYDLSNKTDERLLRLKHVLEIIPVSKSSWWAGVKEGKYPASVKCGSSTFWRFSDISTLVNQISSGTSDGSTATYYKLPKGATELQHLISKKDMNAQIGEIFRSCYRYGESSHSDKLRDAKKIRFYIDAEIERLSK